MSTVPFSAIPAGHDLDCLVAQKIMGWDLIGDYWADENGHRYWAYPASATLDGDVWSPSTNIDHAWEVWGKMKANGVMYFKAFAAYLCVATGALEDTKDGSQPYSEAMYRMDPASICNAALILVKG